jgi:hypothetical protein
MPRDEKTGPAEEETAAAEAAAASGAGSSTSDPFLGDTGPGFDPRKAPEPPAAPELPEPVLLVEEDTIRSLLLNGGDMAHTIAGVGELDWAMTERDLERIAPPLTRIVNRYPAVARVAGRSDEAAVAIGVGMYSWRSMIERRAVLEAQERQAPAQPAPRGPGEPRPQPGAFDPSAAEPTDGYQTFAERLAQTRQEEQQ